MEGSIYRDTIKQKQNLSLGVLKLEKDDKDIKQCSDMFGIFRGIIIYMVIWKRNSSFLPPKF